MIGAVGDHFRRPADSKDEQNLVALEDILSSHPRLGEKKVDSAISRMEQQAMEKASAAGQEGDGKSKLQEQETLRKLNEEYEKTFPGLRYVYGHQTRLTVGR